jgi:hypothetical protein
MLPNNHETLDSAVSYGVGTTAILLSEIASYAEPIALIMGCGVVLLRFLYDGLRLYRLWKNK